MSALHGELEAKATRSPLRGPSGAHSTPHGTWTVTALDGGSHGLIAPIRTSLLPVTRIACQLGLPVLRPQNGVYGLNHAWWTELHTTHR